MSERLRFALETGGLQLPPTGRVGFFGAPGDATLAGLDPGRCEIIQSFAPDHAAWTARGLTVTSGLKGRYAALVVTLPRSRDLAQARLAAAAAASDGPVVLDGAKTDGVEAVARALRSLVTVDGQVSKAHGKCLWFRPGDALEIWRRPEFMENDAGWTVAPGVFSADGPDPGSVALAAHLPATLKGAWADLGAGWGWLSTAVLRSQTLTALHLVEAEKSALDCARMNLDDPRAVFHWADATRWQPPEPLDGVVSNPPFHTGRRADPALGRAFVAAAARALAPHGQLWLVANRHLPYETALSAAFRDEREIGGDGRYKILHAARPLRAGH